MKYQYDTKIGMEVALAQSLRVLVTMIPSRSIDFFEWKFIPVTFFCCCQEIGTYSKILEQLFHIVNVHRWSHFKSMCRFPCFQRKCYQKNWVCIKTTNKLTFIEKIQATTGHHTKWRHVIGSAISWFLQKHTFIIWEN